MIARGDAPESVQVLSMLAELIGLFRNAEPALMARLAEIKDREDALSTREAAVTERETAVARREQRLIEVLNEKF
jgi:hypothetical protein